MLGKIRIVELQKNDDVTALAGVIEDQHGEITLTPVLSARTFNSWVMSEAESSRLNRHLMNFRTSERCATCFENQWPSGITRTWQQIKNIELSAGICRDWICFSNVDYYVTRKSH